MTSPHTILNPDVLAQPRGFSHVVIPKQGRLVFLAGQAAQLSDGSISGSDVAEQFDIAAGNVVAALSAAGALPEHVVTLQIFVTSMDAYRASLGVIGQAYRRHIGDHYPAVSLFEVSGLFDPDALVELVATAVVPED